MSLYDRDNPQHQSYRDYWDSIGRDVILPHEVENEKATFAKLFGAGVELREDQAISRIKSRRMINAMQRRK